jgi:hypothetical protein
MTLKRKLSVILIIAGFVLAVTGAVGSARDEYGEHVQPAEDNPLDFLADFMATLEAETKIFLGTVI